MLRFGRQTPVMSCGCISTSVTSTSPMLPVVAKEFGRASAMSISAVSQATSPPPRMQTVPFGMVTLRLRISWVVMTG